MRLYFQQRLFSWLDSYDIYDEAGYPVFHVQGELSFGHRLRIFDSQGNDIGVVQQRVLTLMPRFELYEGDRMIGTLSREFTFFVPHYNIDFNGWQVEGSVMEWDYHIEDASGRTIADINKELFHLTDTYVIDVRNPDDALYALMFVLAIDAEKCSRK